MHVSMLALCRRIVSLGSQVTTEALLLLGPQFLEVFTIVSASEQQHASPSERSGHAANFTRKLRSVASNAAHHAIHVKRGKDKGQVEYDQDAASLVEGNEEIEKAKELLRDHILSIGVAIPQVRAVRSIDKC